MTLITVLIEALILLIIITAAYLVLAAMFFKDEIKSALERDPAATSAIEIMLTYSGFHAIVIYRITRAISRAKVPFLPRLLSQMGKFITGIEIHPGAAIGRNLFIDHGMGVVIGETTIIGDNVTLYQGVTLGGTGKEKGKRHPTLGDNIVVGAGAKVLGNITIGDNSYIGANAVVIKDVPPNSTIVGVPGRVTKQDGKKIDIGLDHIHTLDPIVQDIEELERRIKKLEDK